MYFHFNGDRAKAQALADETTRDRQAFYAQHEQLRSSDGY
jgi:hypothetical protein